VLFGSSRAHKAIREAIVEGHQLQGVVSMPSGVFKPYAGVSTAILLFTKTNSGGTDQVWFYDMQADGYSLDDKRSELGRRMPEQPEQLAKDEHLSTLTDPHGQVIEYRVQRHGENNIPDILHRWRTPEGEAERPRTAQSFYVPVQEIRDNAYDLSINRYKEIEYEAVDYDPPQELLAHIRQLEAERAQLMQELENLLD
jgi:type I restriction enzyme M protein